MWSAHSWDTRVSKTNHLIISFNIPLKTCYCQDREKWNRYLDLPCCNIGKEGIYGSSNISNDSSPLLNHPEAGRVADD